MAAQYPTGYPPGYPAGQPLQPTAQVTVPPPMSYPSPNIAQSQAPVQQPQVQPQPSPVPQPKPEQPRNTFSQNFHSFIDKIDDSIASALGGGFGSSQNEGRIVDSIKTSSGKVFEIRLDDLLSQKVEVIVNAANERLEHMSGVAGAISRAAGWQFQNESRTFVAQHGPVAEGAAAVTSAGNLQFKGVIHAVGPMWSGGYRREDELLASAVKSVLELASNYGFRSVACPLISGGIFGYPIQRCAMIVVRTAFEFLETHPTSIVHDFKLVDRSPEAVGAMKAVLDDIRAKKPFVLPPLPPPPQTFADPYGRGLGQSQMAAIAPTAAGAPAPNPTPIAAPTPATAPTVLNQSTAAVALPPSATGQRPRTVYPIEFTLEELYKGGSKRVSVPTKRFNLATNQIETVAADHVIVHDAGLKEKSEILFPREGDVVPPETVPQDLVLVVKEKAHPLYTREANNLIHKIRLTLLQALQGVNLNLTLLDGRVLSVNISDVILPGLRKVYPGDGFLSYRDKSKGDLIVEFEVIFPKSFTIEEKVELAKGPLAKQVLGSML